LNASRSICPHIMPCEPPGSCDKGGVCNHNKGYVGYYKPYMFQRDEASGKMLRTCNRIHWTLPKVVTMVPGTENHVPGVEPHIIAHECEFDDMFLEDELVDELKAECEDKFGELKESSPEKLRQKVMSAFNQGEKDDDREALLLSIFNNAQKWEEYKDMLEDETLPYRRLRNDFNKHPECMLYYREARKRSGCTCFAPRCSQCNPGTHFRLDGECEPCPETPWLIPLMLVLGAIFGTAMMVVMRKQNVNTTIINIGIDYFQVVSLFARSKAQWPADFKIALRWFSLFQFDIDLVAPECLPMATGWVTFESKWWVKVLIPFIGGFFVTLAMAYLGFRRICKRMLDKKMTKQERREARKNELPLSTQVISMINTLIYFLYIGICRAALSIFNCVDTKPITGRKFLAAEPMEECGDPRGVQVKLTLPAILILIFYCVGFPVYIMIVFWRLRKRIMADQTLRAHGRGEDPATNKNFGTRKMYGKMYFPYQPKKYWWALVVIIKKFFLVFFGVYFRNYPTFQMAITLFVVFLAFSYHVDNDPFMGMLEKAQIVRAEAEETILREIKKLERAQLLVRINGKAYYQLMHSMRIQIDEQESLMAKHAFSPFNYNVIESILLMTACVIVLAGIMFDSDYILERLVEPEYEIRGKVISWIVLFLFMFSVIYYSVVLVHEFCSAAKRRRTTRQLMWAKIKANSSKIRGMGSKILAGHKMKVGEIGPDGKEITVVGGAAFHLFQAKKQNRFMASVASSVVHPAGGAGKLNRAMVVPMNKSKISPTLPRHSRPSGSGGSSDDNLSFDEALLTKNGAMLSASKTPMSPMDTKIISRVKKKKGSKHHGKHPSDSSTETSSSSEPSDTPSESNSLSSDSDSDVLGDFNHAVDKIEGSSKSLDTMEIHKGNGTVPVFEKDGKRVHQHKHHAKNADGSDVSTSSGSSNSNSSSGSSGSSSDSDSDSETKHNTPLKKGKPPPPPPPPKELKKENTDLSSVTNGIGEGKDHQDKHHAKNADGKVVQEHHHQDGDINESSGSSNSSSSSSSESSDSDKD